MMNYDIELDVTGLNCPLPLLRLKQRLSKADPSQIIKVLATDPAAHLDLGVFIDKSDHTMLHQSQENDIEIFYIQKSPA